MGVFRAAPARARCARARVHLRCRDLSQLRIRGDLGRDRGLNAQRYREHAAGPLVAHRPGDLRPGMTVVEYTGGSTGISLAFVCAVKGYRCRIVCNDAVALEKRRSMEVFGAELEVLKSEGGKLTPDLVPRMMARARDIAAEGPCYATDQMRNPDMVAGYEPLGEELLRQMGGSIHAFCAAVGTSGMWPHCSSRASSARARPLSRWRWIVGSNTWRGICMPKPGPNRQILGLCL